MQCIRVMLNILYTKVETRTWLVNANCVTARDFLLKQWTSCRHLGRTMLLWYKMLHFFKLIIISMHTCHNVEVLFISSVNTVWGTECVTRYMLHDMRFAPCHEIRIASDEIRHKKLNEALWRQCIRTINYFFLYLTGTWWRIYASVNSVVIS